MNDDVYEITVSFNSCYETKRFLIRNIPNRIGYFVALERITAELRHMVLPKLAHALNFEIENNVPLLIKLVPVN